MKSLREILTEIALEKMNYDTLITRGILSHPSDTVRLFIRINQLRGSLEAVTRTAARNNEGSAISNADNDLTEMSCALAMAIKNRLNELA